MCALPNVVHSLALAATRYCLANPKMELRRSRRGFFRKRRGAHPHSPIGALNSPKNDRFHCMAAGWGAAPSVMWRSFIRQILHFVLRRAAPSYSSLPQRLQLPTQHPDLLGELQHRPVLLGHVALEVGDFLFKALDAFVQRRVWR